MPHVLINVLINVHIFPFSYSEHSPATQTGKFFLFLLDQTMLGDNERNIYPSLIQKERTNITLCLPFILLRWPKCQKTKRRR